jgi:hypothetical protein
MVRASVLPHQRVMSTATDLNSCQRFDFGNSRPLSPTPWLLDRPDSATAEPTPSRASQLRCKSSASPRGSVVSLTPSTRFPYSQVVVSRTFSTERFPRSSRGLRNSYGYRYPLTCCPHHAVTNVAKLFTRQYFPINDGCHAGTTEAVQWSAPIPIPRVRIRPGSRTCRPRSVRMRGAAPRQADGGPSTPCSAPAPAHRVPSR